MLGQYTTRTIHVPGVLGADLDVRVAVARGCRLVAVSAVAGNESAATLAIGVAADRESILAPAPIGGNGAPALFGPGDWAGTNRSGRLRAGEVLVVTLDYDGEGGAAAQDVTVEMGFLEG
jgi:hypothetical protein